jgi:AraC-binding-like domain
LKRHPLRQPGSSNALADHREDVGGRLRDPVRCLHGLVGRWQCALCGHAPLALSYITYGCDVSIDPGKLSTFFLVHFIPKGRCQIQIGRENLVGSAIAGSVTSPTLPMRMCWDAVGAHLVLKIDRTALERHLSHLLGEVATRPIEFNRSWGCNSGSGPGFAGLLSSSQVSSIETIRCWPAHWALPALNKL